MEAKQREWRREPTYPEQLTAVTDQLQEARYRIQELEEELEKAKELLAIQGGLGEQTTT